MVPLARRSTRIRQCCEGGGKREKWGRQRERRGRQREEEGQRQRGGRRGEEEEEGGDGGEGGAKEGGEGDGGKGEGIIGRNVCTVLRLIDTQFPDSANSTNSTEHLGVFIVTKTEQRTVHSFVVDIRSEHCYLRKAVGILSVGKLPAQEDGLACEVASKEISMVYQPT